MPFCRWLLKLPLLPLLPVALLLALAPLRPEPHLVEKLRLLVAGDLRRPIDFFDLLLHGLPALLVMLRLAAAAFCRTGNRS